MSAAGPLSTDALLGQPVDFIKFPPFPAPPPGKKILSFKEFKPSGIQIIIDPEPGYVELDGLGIPTVQLRVKHELTETEQKKKKKSKGSKSTVSENGQIRRLAWWEEWEQNEDMRKMSPEIAVNQVDRMHQACDEFRSTRNWPPPTTGVQQLWDFWRLYIGIISSIQPPGGRRKGRQPDPAEDEDSDDDDDKMQDAQPKEHPVLVIDALAAREKDKAQQRLEAEERKKNNEEVYQERFERRQDRKYASMSYFFNDPEYAMKIFFSSHYRDKGYAWNKQRCREGPILLEFFLRFLLRNKVFPEYEEGLNKALAVCETARLELPQTSKIAEAFPESFGKGCAELMGRLGYRIFNAAPVLDDIPASTESDTKKRKVDSEETEEAMKDFKASVDNSNLQFIDSEVISDTVHNTEAVKDAVADNVDVNGVPVRPVGGWGPIVGDNAEASGWGNSTEPIGENVASTGNLSWGDGMGLGGWGADGELDTGASSSVWNTYMKNPIFDLFGPTLLPFTHTTGIVENSVRQISKILLPNTTPSATKSKKKGKKAHPAEVIEEELEQRLAQVTLSPWVKVGNHTASDIEPPSFLPDSRGPVVPVLDKAKPAAAEAVPAPAAEDSALLPKPHDLMKDDIIVLMDPEVAKILMVGMGQRGIWVQLVRTDTSASEPATGKVGGPGKNGEPTKWWYLEDALGTFVSFHTDRYYPNQD